MSGILRLESLTKGNTLKQGDKTPLKYRLFDADGDTLNIAGKSAKVRLVYPDFLTIGYEKDGLTVAQDDTVTFTIDSVIPSRIYHVEIIVDGQFIFPSRSDESKFTVDKSSLGTEANIIEIVGKDILIREVKSQVDIELQPLVTSLESAQQAEAQRVLAEQERVQGYQEIQQIIEDGALSAVPADGSLTTEKFAPDSVTIEKTSFIKKSSNLLDKSKLIPDRNLDLTTGEVVPSSQGLLVSPFIEIDEDQDYFSVGFNRKAFYDSDGVFISGIPGNDLLNQPSGTKYIRYSTREPDTVQLNRETTALPYEPYYTPYIDGVDIADIPDGSVTSSKISNNAVGIDKVDFITYSSNLLNMESLTTGKVINSSGALVNNASYATSESINVSNIDAVTSKYVHYLSWFRNGTFISRSELAYSDTTTTQKPFGATTLVASVNTGVSQFADKIMQINAGDTLLPFEPWGIEIKGMKSGGGQQTPQISQTIDDFRSFDQFVVEGDLDTYYTAPTFPSKPDLESMTPQYLWNEADLLVNEFPHYVTKQLFGKDSSGVYDIPYYTLSPPKIPSLAGHLQHVRPKMILIAGNHGYEKTASWIMVQAMREIAENWKNSSALEALRWNVDLIFVPNANPSAWPEGQVGTRTNSNGVDIARNFEYGWNNAPTSSGTSKGSKPLSEVEAQHIDNLLKDNQQETIFFTSYHNMTTSDANPEQFIWYPASNKYQRNIGKEYLSRLSRKWKKDYEWLPQDDLTYFGYVDNQGPMGSEGHQANLYGIQGGTFETSRIFKLEESPTNQSSLAITLGVEAFINLLLVNLKYGTEYYNLNKKPDGKFTGDVIGKTF